MSISTWTSFLYSQILQFPFLLVYIVAIVLSIVRWQRHPQVSRISLIAFLCFLLNQILQGVRQLLIMSALDRGESILSQRGVVAVWAILGTGLGLLGWTLLIIAIFGWRVSDDA